MKIDHRRFQPHGYIRMATGSALANGVGDFGGLQHKEIGQPMHKLRYGLVVGIDTAEGVAGFVLERGEGAPFVNDPFILRARADC